MMPQRAHRACSTPGCPHLVRDERWCASCEEKALKERQAPEARAERERKWAGMRQGRASGSRRTGGRRFAEFRETWMRAHPLCGDRLTGRSGQHSECVRVGLAVQGEHLDHIVPHNGNDALFWSQENMQTLCRGCHGTKTAKEMNRRRTEMPEELMFPTDLPSPSLPVVVVAGAPASGKSTYVACHAEPGDVVIDLDDLVRTLGVANPRAATVEERRAGLALRNERLKELSRNPTGAKRAWLTTASPEAHVRMRWAVLMGAEHVILVEATEEECMLRVSRDPERLAAYALQHRIINGWFSRYSPWHRDEHVRPLTPLPLPDSRINPRGVGGVDLSARTEGTGRRVGVLTRGQVHAEGLMWYKPGRGLKSPGNQG